MKARCMKCQAQKDMKNPHVVTIKGRKYTQGKCPKCGTKMCTTAVKKTTKKR